MARRINKIQFVYIPAGRLIRHPDSARLDSNAAFSLQMHVIQQLLPELSLVHSISNLKQSIRDNAKIPYVVFIHNSINPKKLYKLTLSKCKVFYCMLRARFLPKSRYDLAVFSLEASAYILNIGSVPDNLNISQLLSFIINLCPSKDFISLTSLPQTCFGGFVFNSSINFFFLSSG